MVKAVDGKEAIVVRYLLSSVGSSVKLDRHCPHCGSPNGRVHSGLRRRGISDLRASVVVQRRMQCPRCRMTWTLGADGVGPGRHRSDRLIGIGVLLYMLGLSYRAVEQFLPCLDCGGSKSSIERDLAAAGQQARSLHEAAPPMRVGVLGVDGTGAAMAGRNAGVLFFVDVAGGRLICVEPIRETQTATVRRHVRRVFATVGAEELRTDEHSVYEGIVDPSRHRLCLTHWRKSKGKRAWDLLQQATRDDHPLEARTLEDLRGLLRQTPRPPRPPPELTRLVGRYITARRGLPGKVNQLLQHVERTWEAVSDDPVDPTNNTTERLIGLTFKIRTKTMRGFKSIHKVLAHPHLAGFLRGDPQGRCDLRKII